MVQTLNTIVLLSGKKIILFEKPYILKRIFFSVRVLAGQTTWYDMKMSFGDPLFHAYYGINGPEKYFEAAGVDIFQGDIWLYNNSDTDFWYSTSQILH